MTDFEGLRQLYAKVDPGEWFIEDRPTNVGLAAIDDGRSNGMFPVIGEWPQVELIVAAVNALPVLLDAERELRAFKACHGIGRPEDGYRELVWRDAAEFYEGEGSNNLIKDLREALKTLVMQRDAHFHTAAAWGRARELIEAKAPEVTA